jgi:hypothetical protein
MSSNTAPSTSLSSALTLFHSSLSAPSSIPSALPQLQSLHALELKREQSQSLKSKKLSLALSDAVRPVELSLHENSLKEKLANAKRALKPTARAVSQAVSQANAAQGKEDGKRKRVGDEGGEGGVKKKKDGSSDGLTKVAEGSVDVGDEIRCLVKPDGDGAASSVAGSALVKGIITFVVEGKEGKGTVYRCEFQNGQSGDYYVNDLYSV